MKTLLVCRIAVKRALRVGVSQLAASSNARIASELRPYAHALFYPRASELSLAVRKRAGHSLVVALAPALHKVLAEFNFKSQALLYVMPHFAASKAQDNVGTSKLSTWCNAFTANLFKMIFFLTVM